MRCLWLVVVCTFVLVACGGTAVEQPTSDATAASIQVATVTAQASSNATATFEADCPAQASAYDVTVTDMLKRWEDQVKLATSTPRNQLAVQIQGLQTTKREAEALAVPVCAQTAQAHLIEGMDTTITGFMGFMSQTDQALYDYAFAEAKKSFDLYRFEIDKAKEQAAQAVTPTP